MKNISLGDKSLSDSELILKVREGDRGAFGFLCARYMGVCRSLARGLVGYQLDSEDLSQEGMIGLVMATRHFDPQLQVPFEVYAKKCMTSRMMSALSAQKANKRRANLGALPIDGGEAESFLLSPSPDDLVIERESAKFRMEQITSLLSKSESLALKYYLRGYSYLQIAALCEIPPKSVDNALQRVRRKLKTAL